MPLGGAAMDANLYKQLPSGAAWWKNKSEHAARFLQGPAPVPPSGQVNVQVAVLAPLAHPFANEVVAPAQKDARVSPARPLAEPAVVAAPTQKGAPQVSSAQKGAPSVTPATLSANEVVAPAQKGAPQVFDYIINRIDNLSSVYPAGMKGNADKLVKSKIQDMVTSADGQLFFGSRKTRSIIAWLSGNAIAENSEAIISNFLSWFLDETIVTAAEYQKKYRGMGGANCAANVSGGTSGAAGASIGILEKASSGRRQNVWTIRNITI